MTALALAAGFVTVMLALLAALCVAVVLFTKTPGHWGIG